MLDFSKSFGMFNFMKMYQHVYLVTIICLLGTTHAARILGIFPIAAKSHFSCNNAIMKSLHDAGHQVTMITPFNAEGATTKNFTYSRFNTAIFLSQPLSEDLNDFCLNDMMNITTALNVQYCYDVMQLREIQEALNSTEKLYDIMFVELLVAHECYLPIAEKLGIPVIGTVTMRSWKLADHAIGVPHNPAIIPMELTVSKPRMTLIERLQNVWENFVVDFHQRTNIRREINKFYRKYFSEDLLYKKDVSLIFFNNHASLLPRPSIPNAIDIGGIHVQPAQPLPKDIQKFIDEAPQGVILFTFGSVVKASTLPTKLKQAFIDAFAHIPQRVIWKYEEPIENISKNVMLSTWIPQRDILEHEKVIAFMSHCGQSGIYEAVMTGTPVVTMPLFADQPSNAALLHHRGVGVHLDVKTVTKEKVLAALNTIINDTSYYHRMQEFSRVFKDRPMSPQQMIVYWTEYVLRHNGTSYLKALGTDMPLYEYIMLDIVGIVLAFICFVLFVIYKLTKKILTIVRKGLNIYVPLVKKNQ